MGMARARYWAEMTKLWLMVAIVALVLSGVQCAEGDDVGLDTREFMQQESLYNLSFNANLQERQSMSSETEDGSRRRRRRKWSGKAVILTANQKRMVRKYLKNMFTTSVEGHHTCWHVGGTCGLYMCMRFGRCGRIKRGPGKACRRTIGKVCCPCGQKNKRAYIKLGLERLEQGATYTKALSKSLAQYKIAAASKSMALCVKKNCASGNLQSLDELLETSDDATAG